MADEDPLVDAFASLARRHMANARPTEHLTPLNEAIALPPPQTALPRTRTPSPMLPPPIEPLSWLTAPPYAPTAVLLPAAASPLPSSPLQPPLPLPNRLPPRQRRAQTSEAPPFSSRADAPPPGGMPHRPASAFMGGGDGVASGEGGANSSSASRVPTRFGSTTAEASQVSQVSQVSSSDEYRGRLDGGAFGIVAALNLAAGIEAAAAALERETRLSLG